MSLTENASKVLERRYLTKDENGKSIENIDELFRRVAKAVAQADKQYNSALHISEVEEEFYQLMVNLEFMPNSPTLMNAGKPLGQLSACFVLPIEDSMEDIFDAVKYAALIHKSGGGTGFSFSRLRAKGATVRSTGGVASGPVSFMKVFNAATEAVKQGGTRRGANMGILRVDHPDIKEFIQCKKNNNDLTNFNISVGITEVFMEAVKQGSDYDLVDPKTRQVFVKQNAQEIFDLIVDMAWKNGEPGIIFLDRLNQDNCIPEIGEIESTNPCGEQPLLPYESCNLGSINLNTVIEKTDIGFSINYAKLARIIDTAVHFLDNVIDVNRYPLPEIETMTKGTRKIGLGVMGYADMLFKLGISYNSEEAVALAGKIMRFIQDRSHEASRELAKQRGAFPYCDKSIYSGDEDKPRNATTTTIAPTGTISIICNSSSGVEPLFAISFIRNVMDHDELLEIHPYFKEVAQREGFFTEELMKKIAKSGTLHGIKEVPEYVQSIFVTAHDIEPDYHIRIQAAFQKYTDNAVSKTVNFSNTATSEDVKKAYLLAYELGCKGITIYRDGSRDAQVLNIGEVNKKTKDTDSSLKIKIEERIVEKATKQVITPRPRPDVTMGITEKVKIGCGNLYITVNYDNEGISEVFTNLGRAGGCPSQSEATSRLVSLALRSGIDVMTLIEQLKGIRCHSTMRQKGLKVLSCPDAIGRVLEKVMKLKLDDRMEAVDIDIGAPQTDPHHFCLSNCSLCSLKEVCQNPSRENGGVYIGVGNFSDKKVDAQCPECNSVMEHEGGCVICRSCGYSKCG